MDFQQTRFVPGAVSGILSFSLLIALLFALTVTPTWADDEEHNGARLKISKAEWDPGKSRLVFTGRGRKDATVTITNAFDSSLAYGKGKVDYGENNTRWRIRYRDPVPVPCRVRATQSGGKTAERDVIDRSTGKRAAGCAPAGPNPGGNNQPPVCSIDSPASDITVTVGGSVDYSATVSDSDGSVAGIVWDFPGGTPSTAGVEDPGTVTYSTEGSFTTTLSATDDQGIPCASQVRTVTVVSPSQGNLITDPVNPQTFAGNSNFRLLAANDLGMHCADQDFQIFSILPPFNVIHAQVIERGRSPLLVTPSTHPGMSVVYSATGNTNDPSISNSAVPSLAGTARAAVSINSTSQNDAAAGIFKSNFWDTNPNTGNPIGFDAYDNIFFGLLNPGAVSPDTGLPVPDSVLLPACLSNPASCQFSQQVMPGIGAPYLANSPRTFDRFDQDVNFFGGVLPSPLGGTIQDVKWWAADGVPATGIDDAGRVNAYPLMRVQARNGGTVVASTDIVLPVASEADCQNCHADPIDCVDPSLPQELQNSSCTGAAADPGDFLIETLAGAPGDTPEQKLLNASKINILRLHDVDHGSSYPGGWGNCDAAANPQNPAAWNGNCLANRTPVSCSQCHYSPALDLAQLGPVDDPAHQVFQTTVNISMSAVMHGFHARFTDLFPNMPPPDQPRNTGLILEQTCYQCHPGKRTQCLRGAMGSGGVVCQDCHGQMADVGNDFTTGGTRVPWASEPKCQSCHTGDAANLNHPAGAIVASDGVRLLQAFTTDANSPTLSPNSRFAENENLYRLSGNAVTARANQGHEGIMCEGCHGSTHAIWPNANPFANDNVAASQLQGHAGTLVECDTCHTGDLGNTLKGPHGMHPVGNVRFVRGGHEDMAERNLNACAACHGKKGQGTVLSRVAVNRTLTNIDDKGTVRLRKGQLVDCGICHSNPFKGGGDD